MTTTELETIMYIGFAALARAIDREKLPFALEYVNGIIGNKRAKLTEAERSGLQLLFDTIEFRAYLLEIDAADSARTPPVHLKLVDPAV